MDRQERTAAGLKLQQPDRVPIFSCAEAQNHVHEVLGEQDSAVPLTFVQEGLVGALLRRAAPLVSALGIFNRDFGKFLLKKVEADGTLGYDCNWVMHSAIFDLRDNHQATDICGRLYDLVGDQDGNMDTPMFRQGLLPTPDKWDAWPHPDPDRFHRTLERAFSNLQHRLGDQIYLMGSLLFGLWENATQTMGLPAFTVTLRRVPSFVRRMANCYESLYARCR